MNGAADHSNEWCARCARRISELDPELSQEEANEIASEFQAFERTSRMGPQAAAEFVVAEMARPDPPRFERRSSDRSPHTPILRYLSRLLTPRPADHA